MIEIWRKKILRDFFHVKIFYYLNRVYCYTFSIRYCNRFFEFLEFYNEPVVRDPKSEFWSTGGKVGISSNR